MAAIEIKGVDALVRKLGKAAANQTLRPAMQRSVCNAPKFAGDVEQAFTNMLERAAGEEIPKTSKLASQERSQ